MSQVYYNQFKKFQQNREKHFSPKILKALKAQYLEFLGNLKNGEKDTMLISSSGIAHVLKEVYLDSRHYGLLIYSQLPKAPAKKKAAPLGFNDSFIQMINDYFQNEILKVSEWITQTTRDLISEIMQQATTEGWSLNKIEDEITTQSDEITQARARLIARTETVTASNKASFFGAAKTGLLMKKKWLSAHDNRVRPDHRFADGVTVDMTNYFMVGSSEMLVPGARIQANGLPTPAREVVNCRCVVLYQPVRVNGALVEHDYGNFD